MLCVTKWGVYIAQGGHSSLTEALVWVHESAFGKFDSG